MRHPLLPPHDRYSAVENDPVTRSQNLAVFSYDIIRTRNHQPGVLLSAVLQQVRATMSVLVPGIHASTILADARISSYYRSFSYNIIRLSIVGALYS